MAKERKKRIHFSIEHEVEARPARIVSEPGRIYLRDGKLIPLVVIDTNERPDLDSLLASYTPETVGDVAIQWGRRDGAPKGTVTLYVQFIAPVKRLLILDFEIVRLGQVVDGILRTRELYLQGVRSGDADTQVQTPKVKVVVPDTEFDAHLGGIADRRARTAVEGTRHNGPTCPVTGSGVHPTLADRSKLANFQLKRPRIRSAVDEQALPGNEPGVRGAEERTERT